MNVIRFIPDFVVISHMVQMLKEVTHAHNQTT